MGKYDYLSNEEKRVLQEMAEAYDARGITEWLKVLHPKKTEDSYCLKPADDYGTDTVSGIIAHAPESADFYRGLEQKGFVILGRRGIWGNASLLRIQFQQPTAAYGEYAGKSDLGRWWDDLTYVLVEESTVWAKLLWVVLGYALGFLSAILLRVLGWIRVGN